MKNQTNFEKNEDKCNMRQKIYWKSVRKHIKNEKYTEM